MAPPQNTDSHPAPDRGGPIACLGGPVAYGNRPPETRPRNLGRYRKICMSGQTFLEHINQFEIMMIHRSSCSNIKESQILWLEKGSPA